MQRQLVGEENDGGNGQSVCDALSEGGEVR